MVPVWCLPSWTTVWISVVLCAQPDSVRTTMVGRLGTLTHLDQIPVSEEEVAAAAQTTASSRITQVQWSRCLTTQQHTDGADEHSSAS